MEHEGPKGRKGHKGHQGLAPGLEAIGREIVDSAFKVHTHLGPGLLESAYESCLAHELSVRGFSLARQVAFPLVYEGLTLDVGYRLDLLVEESVVVEIKAAEAMSRLFEAQVLTYLKLSACRLGYLINFNVAHMRDGLRRFVR